MLLSLSCAGADQNDVRLDGLFDQLRASTDAAQGERISDRIWSIWLEVDDEVTGSDMNRGRRAMQASRHQLALTALNRVVERSPEFAEGWNRRATLFYLMGELHASVADILRTLALEPRHFGALAGLGLIYMRLDRAEEAVQAFERALQVNPHMAGAKENLRVLRRKLLQPTV